MGENEKSFNIAEFSLFCGVSWLFFAGIRGTLLWVERLYPQENRLYHKSSGNLSSVERTVGAAREFYGR